MNKTKIEWVKGSNGELGYTWNPVTGCRHKCKDQYCYAAKIAKRFGVDAFLGKETIVIDAPVEVSKNEEGPYRVNPYPALFRPTCHRYRLDEPQKLKKPSKIFVVSMGDLFGEWVPDEWIAEVFKACEAAPQHTYMFLTKNPKRYLELQFKIPLPTAHKYWYGSTANCFDDFKLGNRAHYLSDLTGVKKFLSIEPLLGDIGEIGLANLYRYDWVIIGQQTGPGAKPPKYEWVQSIIGQCRAEAVPVFVKPPLYEKFPIQQWPEGMSCRS